MTAKQAPVAVHASHGGVDTMNASQSVARNIVACTHQRSGTESRSR